MNKHHHQDHTQSKIMISESRLFERRKKPRSLDSRRFLSELQNQDSMILPKIRDVIMMMKMMI